MAGCFGNSPYDKWLEQQTLDYCDQQDYDPTWEEEMAQADAEYDRQRDDKLMKLYEELTNGPTN